MLIFIIVGIVFGYLLWGKSGFAKSSLVFGMSLGAVWVFWGSFSPVLNGVVHHFSH